MVKTAWVNNLLGIVMFGMGLTLKPEDFKVVFSRPKDVIVGCVAQFTLMPFLAWALTQVFHLPTELAIGVILVGTCPGGTSSNVMTYLSKGDVALSVGMTAVSTVLAPLLTPLLTLLYAGQRVDVNPVNMFLSIVKVVLVPIALGFVVNHFFHKFTEEAVRVLPLVSTTAIVLIICAVVSANSAKIMTSGLLILVVVILHNVLGYLTGFGVGKLLKLDSTKCRAISIEVGMQNSGSLTRPLGEFQTDYAALTKTVAAALDSPAIRDLNRISRVFDSQSMAAIYRTHVLYVFCVKLYENVCDFEIETLFLHRFYSKKKSHY